MKANKCVCGHYESKHTGTVVVWNPEPGQRTHMYRTCTDLRCDCRKFETNWGPFPLKVGAPISIRVK